MRPNSFTIRATTAFRSSTLAARKSTTDSQYFLSQRADRFTGPFAADAIQAGDIRAGFGERQRHALTQSLPRAGDECNFSIEFE